MSLGMLWGCQGEGAALSPLVQLTGAPGRAHQKLSTEPRSRRAKQNTLHQSHNTGRLGWRNQGGFLPQTDGRMPAHGRPVLLRPHPLPVEIPTYRQLKHFNGRNVNQYLSYHYVETNGKNTFWVLCSGKNCFLIQILFSHRPIAPWETEVASVMILTRWALRKGYLSLGLGHPSDPSSCPQPRCFPCSLSS